MDVAPAPSRLEEHVQHIVLDFHPRDFTHPENLGRAADYIGDALKRAGAQVSDQPFEAGGGAYRNVIGSFGPETQEVIVVGAHYDTDGEMPGADDNASGVAALLELAPAGGAGETLEARGARRFRARRDAVFRDGSDGQRGSRGLAARI